MPDLANGGQSAPLPAPDGALIDIIIGQPAGGVAIEHDKPPLSRLLSGRRVDEALSLIPLLLPVCGVAQSVAARRAVEAALDDTAAPEIERNRELEILIERAAAQAWRFTMDWPPLVGEQVRPADLKSVRDAAAIAKKAIGSDATQLQAVLMDVAVALAALIPELNPEAHQDAEPNVAFDRLMDGKSIPARVLQLARDHEAGVKGARNSAAVTLAGGGAALHDQLAHAFAAEPFDSTAPAMKQPIDVGPVAYCADGQVADVLDRFGYCATTRLFAMIVTAIGTVAALRDWRNAAGDPNSSGVQSGKAGRVSIGGAMTARGPVLHAVRLGGDVVVDWRILAPTDWHFAPDGAAAKALADPAHGKIDRSHAEIVVASFDPCARVKLTVY